MPAKRPLRVLVLVLAFGLLPATAVLATHQPTAADVITVAQSFSLECFDNGALERCTGSSQAGFRSADITPAFGPLVEVTTYVTAVSNLSRTNPWVMYIDDQTFNKTLHNVGCNNPKAVAAYVDSVAALGFAPGTVPPAYVGECYMTGALQYPIEGSGPPGYTITARILSQATPSPSPTPSPTPIPTATPNPTATAVVTPLPTATPRPTPTGTATATATATSESASSSASESASASPTTTPSSTPEQSVKGVVFTPEPSVPEGAPDKGVGGWPGSVPGAGDVSTKPADLGGSAAAALLMLVAMGFIGELFNNTMETNYDRILGWWKKSWVGRIGRGVGGLFGGGST